MLKFIFSIVITTNTVFISYAQQAWTTQITPNNSGEIATKLIKTQDGGFLTVLFHVDVIQNPSQNIGYTKIALVKLDNNGDTVIYKKINIKDSTYVLITDFIEIPTGELLLSGQFTTVTANDTTQGTLLVKTTGTGDTLWTKINYNHIGTGSSHRSGQNIVGFTNKFWTLSALLVPQYPLYYFIYEYDYNGNLLNINYQDTMVVYNSFSYKPKLYKDINDTVLVVANWKNEGFKLKKMDSFFNQYATATQYISKPAVSSDGSMAFISNDLWKTSSQFDSIWYHPPSEYKISWGAGTSQNTTNSCPTSDGGYAMIGDTWNALVNNIYLIKTDALGNKQFSEMYWSVTSHNIDVVEANDGGFVMMNTGTGTGFSNESGAGIWIVKTDANGIIGVEESTFLKNEVLLYPNPTKDLITIKLNPVANANVVVYSIAGEQMLSKKITNSDHFQMSVESLPKGMYLVQIQMKDTFITKKLIKN